VIELKPDDFIGNPWVPGFLGSLLGQRALSGVGWAVRLGYLLSSWAAAILFGPWLAGWLGAEPDPRAFAAVCGATAAFGIVVFDGIIRYLRDTSFPDLIVQLMSVFKGGGK